jgi:fatty-acyl-CoA synthase
MVKSMNVAWWVERWASFSPAKTALVFGGETISYSDLHRRANRTSCWLQDLGIEKGDRVATFLHNCAEFIELYLACARIGAIFVPVNFRLAPPELEYILNSSRPGLLVYGTDYAETIYALNLSERRPPLLWAKVGPGEGVPGSRDYSSEIAEFDGRMPFAGSALSVTDPEERQVIMYTSGTTGHPKGAVLSHRKTFFNCLNAEIFFNLAHDDVLLVVMPLFHSGGLFIMASPALYKGATQVIEPRFDAEALFRDIEEYRVTTFLGVPTMYRQLFRVDPRTRADLSSLKVCAIGGEKVTSQLIAECHRHGFRVRQIMGQTETSILLWASEEESLQRPGTVGRPVFHAEVAVLNSTGVLVKPPEVGELVVRGATLMKEYWHDPVETERTMKGGWLHTGDLARQDEEGYFYLVDRVRDMYVSGGENIYPDEVERVLAEHPGIEEAAVVGAPDEHWGEVGHCYVICKQGVNLTAQDVLGFCQGRLARYKWPAKVVFCRDLPRTPLGKVRKFLLKKRMQED